MPNIVFYLVLVLHGTPFTQAKPFPDEAACQQAGVALALDINKIDAEAKAVAACLKIPPDTAFLNTPNPPIRVEPDPLGASPVNPEVSPNADPRVEVPPFTVEPPAAK